MSSGLPQIRNVHVSLGDLLNKMSCMYALEESLISQIKSNNEKLGFLIEQIPASDTGVPLVLDKERKEIIDITDRKKAEKMVKHKLDELERFNRAIVDRELRMIGLNKEI